MYARESTDCCARGGKHDCTNCRASNQARGDDRTSRADSDDVRTQKREAMVRFMTAVIKAQRFMYTNPVETKRVAVDNTKAKPEVIDKAYDDLSKGGVWSVNDGMPQKLIDYTIAKEAELGTIKPDNKPTCESVVDKTIVDEAIKRNGGLDWRSAMVLRAVSYQPSASSWSLDRVTGARGPSMPRADRR